MSVSISVQPLTPRQLLAAFGSKGRLAASIAGLSHSLESESATALEQWQQAHGRPKEKTLAKIVAVYERAVRRWGTSVDESSAARLLFAVQSYYATVVRVVAERFGAACANPLPPTVFDWPQASMSRLAQSAVAKLRGAVAQFSVPNSPDAAECDLFKALYQDLFPRPLRHTLGEYYTPDWLAEHVLDQIGYDGDTNRRLLDPACGSGTFLILALRRLLQQGRKGDGGGGSVLQLSNSIFSFPPSALTDHWPLTAEANAETLGPQSKILNLKSRTSPASHPTSPVLPIAGFDLNPLAVLTARANVQIVLAEHASDLPPVHIPIYCRDSILDRGDGDATAAMPFDYVVGNPPWIAWDNLADGDRQATKPLWERYGLFSLSGNEARHGGGKKDLSMLMLYAATDRYLKPGGRLSMVITQTLFQSARAGDGFRRFRLGDDGPPLRVLRVDDLVGIKAFDASNWTSVVTLEKGAATQYPVPYYKWERTDSTDPPHPSSSRPPLSAFRLHPCSASPVDPARPTSPWRVDSSDTGGGEHRELPSSSGRRAGGEGKLQRSSDALTLTLSQRERGQSAIRPPIANDVRSDTPDYTAYLGANSGGANGVFWLEAVRRTDDGIVVRNITAKSKRAVVEVEQTIEPELLYPLLRWRDVGRYRAVPSCHLLLAQDAATRSGIPLENMRERWPRTLDYLSQFRAVLEARAAYRRYQAAGPFYSMYNVGPYTVAPVKVVWRRMDRRINAAVVEPIDDPLLGVRPVLAQETCVIVPCETIDEAHYLCAMMNSATINELVAAHSIAGGKSFGTPGTMRYLPLQRFDPQNERHQELARLSREAHQITDERQAATGASKIDAMIACLQSQIDDIAAFGK